MFIRNHNSSLLRRDSNAIPRKNKIGFTELIQTGTGTKASSRIIYESVARALLTLTKEGMVIATSVGMIAGFTGAGPMMFTEVMNQMASTPKKWKDAKTPKGTVDKPDPKNPEIKFSFREQKASSTSDLLKGIHELLSFQLLESLTQSFDTMMNDVMAARLNLHAEDIIRQPLSSAIARGAATALVPLLEKTFTKSISSIVSPRLSSSAVVVRRITKAITSAVVRSVTLAVGMSVSRSPMSDYYCYYCKNNKMYCDNCAESERRFSEMYLQSSFFAEKSASYYASNYGDYYNAWTFVDKFVQGGKPSSSSSG